MPLKNCSDFTLFSFSILILANRQHKVNGIRTYTKIYENSLCNKNNSPISTSNTGTVILYKAGC